MSGGGALMLRPPYRHPAALQQVAKRAKALLRMAPLLLNFAAGTVAGSKHNDKQTRWAEISVMS